MSGSSFGSTTSHSPSDARIKNWCSSSSRNKLMSGSAVM